MKIKLRSSFIALLCLIAFVGSANAALAFEFNEKDVDFISNNHTLNLPVNQKTLVRFNNIPADIDIVQAVIVNKHNRFRALVLGDPQKEVSSLYYRPYVEFLIGVDEFIEDEPAFQAIELHLKGFTKDGSAYKVKEKVRTIIVPTI